ATTPWVNAADDLDPDDGRLERWRAAGFTTALTSPDQGFFPGQAAVIGLAGGFGRDMVLATPSALRINLRGGPGHRGFPGSLMGTIAYLRQTFLDARRYGEVWDLYNRDPEGLERPAYDRALAPLLDVVREGRPVLLPATTAVQMQRMARLADELGLQAILYGAHEGYRAAPALAGSGVRVLVSLDFPKAARNGDPEAEPDLSVLRLRERAPTTPAALARAGIPFAFYSDGLRDPAQALDAVRLAVAAGLDRDAAVRALTLAPAEMFGVADRVGTVEEGKIANLTVTAGDLFDAGARVRMVFVDGRPYEADTSDERRAEGGDAEGGEGGGRAEGARGERAAEPVTFAGVTPMTPRGPYAEADTWFITGATILTGTGERIENGQIVVRDGRIADIGTGLSAPRGAQVIDATGQWIIPGIIDAHSHIAGEGGINEGT
ncbi:MAG: hypothetical protein D6701_09395, partial [Gemmatimonadetes bacterium]